MPVGGVLSGKEKAQWLLHRLNPELGICNLAMAMVADRPLRWWPLQEALNHVARRHPALRTVFPTVGSQPRRVRRATIEVPVSTHAAESDLHTLTRELAAMPFDVERGPLIRAHLITLPDGGAVCVVLHHLVADAISCQVVLRELRTLYDAYADGQAPPAHLAEPVPEYAEADPDDDGVQHWTRHLSGLDLTRLELPGARPLPAEPTFAGERLERNLSVEAVTAVERMRRRLRATDNIILLAAYYLLLAAHGAGPDLVVGVLSDTRRGAAAEAVGFHVSTLPVRVHVGLDAGFDTLVHQVRAAFLTSLENGHVSAEAIQHVLDLRSADWRVPLFRHAFNFRPVVEADDMLAGRPVRLHEVHSGLTRLDLELHVWHEPGQLRVRAEYSREVHDREDVEALLARLENLLVTVESRPADPVGTIDFATEDDRAVLAKLNDTRREWPRVSLLEQIAAQDPRAPAIEGWSYADLLAAAAGVRAELAERGVKAGDVVGLYAARGRWLAASVLGVWAAGAAYLPLDPSHPGRRLADQLDDAGVTIILADRDVRRDCTGSRHVVKLPQVVADVWKDTPVPAELACVLYTSGSTGRPKGVEVTHANMANVVRHFADALEATSTDRMLWLTTFSFDISALELLVPLVTGGQVVVAPDEVRTDAKALLALMEQVSLIQATPTTWRHLAPSLDGRLRGRWVLCGGEALGRALAERLVADGCRLMNVYGPTETTIWSAASPVGAPVPERIGIGTPIANTTVEVRDPAGRPVPPGVPGELYIGGAGVTRGYRGMPQATSERFRDGHYRTGDQARIRHDGQLEFLGRADRQVKVLGHRIELTEVESVLEEHPEVVVAAVFCESDTGGQNRLVAAVQGSAVPERLREHVAGRLPGPTVPGRFVIVDSIPTTGNGKVDYRALAQTVPRAAAELPADPLVRRLVRWWRTLLEDEGLGADSNFFLCGGHSLLAGRLAEEITAAFGVSVGFDLAYRASTPAQLAAWLRAEGVTE